MAGVVEEKRDQFERPDAYVPDRRKLPGRLVVSIMLGLAGAWLMVEGGEPRGGLLILAALGLFATSI